ncbi:Rrf2-linked NADH-flavin reductase [Streptococcus oralis]|uniref:Rrf2-linked NADH-flavin reductase n=1 Tax=Streptococcus oralis TaxID=1303 RepID=A0A139NYZ0_STROR|nr:NAD(P)-dependent oxidoreductase [Streptococcus oralis]KXT81170.1 Rrf2-linked NADH-flavin reductase [Streptococcus oralis]
MKLAVIAANGQAGKAIVEEAIKRGHEVTAIVRSENKSQAQSVILKDLFDLTKDDLIGFDAVVSAFGAYTLDTLPLHSKSIELFDQLLAGTSTRLIVVGGAGSLYIDETKTTRLIDTPEFPEEFKPLAKAQADELDLLRTKNNLNWTFVSPAADFIPDGEKTGNYILAGEIFTTNGKGMSQISYADYAIGLVDELEKGHHIKERISLLEK